MTTASYPSSAEPLRLVLLIQAALLSVSAIEAAVFGAATGGLSAAAVLTAAAAVLVFGARRRLERIRRLRWLIRLEYLLLAIGFIEFLLAVFLARRPLDAVAAMTQIFLPALVIVLARRQKEVSL